MFFWVMLSKVPPSIKRASAERRLYAQFLVSQSQGFNSPKPPPSSSSSSLSSSGGSRHGGSTGKESSFDLFQVSSEAWIVGSSLGLCYWCSLHNPNSQPILSFADYTKDQEAACATSEDQFAHPLQPDEKKASFLFNESYRRRVFFNYEKRIRMQSPPEKVFEYFASVKGPTGEIFMTPADLMRAIVPVFPPTESNRVREGFLRGERVHGELYCPPSKFFMLFDTNNDGLISFSEYIFFITMLSIPEESFAVAFKMFDLDNDGVIDREEFKKVMELMRSQNRQAATHRGGRRLGLKAENRGLVEYFFGEDGNHCVQLEKFVEFLRNLQEEILWLEFSHYDYKMRGAISAKDFALSLVASAGINHINKLLDRVGELDNEPQLKEIEIAYEEFKAFAELRKKLQSFSLAIFSYGKVTGSLTKPDFQRAASQVCGITLTDKVIDIIFHVFDANRDGSLSANELVSVLQKRESNTQSRSPGFRGMVDCWLNCATSCSSTKLNI